jgi:hypothetical protein
MTTADAPEPANRDQQQRGPPPERLVRQPTRERVPGDAFAAAAPAPIIGLADPARQDHTIRLQTLPDSFQAELLQAAEGRSYGLSSEAAAVFELAV